MGAVLNRRYSLAAGAAATVAVGATQALARTAGANSAALRDALGSA